MDDYRLNEGLYLLPTPAGAYTAVTHPGEDPVHRLLYSLLRQESAPRLTQTALESWTGQQGSDAQESLFHAQTQQWIEGFAEPRQGRSGSLEVVLPTLLPPLAHSGKVLLSDTRGWGIASAGFTHEEAQEISHLCSDIASLHDRHAGLVRNNPGFGSGAWALVDAAGNSQLGFWPLTIAPHRFVLALQGEPRFNQPAFTELVWALSTRYTEQPTE